MGLISDHEMEPVYIKKRGNLTSHSLFYSARAEAWVDEDVFEEAVWVAGC
jgi:hypothetical protein